MVMPTWLLGRVSVTTERGSGTRARILRAGRVHDSVRLAQNARLQARERSFLRKTHFIHDARSRRPSSDQGQGEGGTFGDGQTTGVGVGRAGTGPPGSGGTTNGDALGVGLGGLSPGSLSMCVVSVR